MHVKYFQTTKFIFMKQLFSFGFLCLFILSSCTKDDSNNTPSFPDNVTMKIDGVSWTGTLLVNAFDNNTSIAQLSATNASQLDGFNFIISSYSKIGTYTKANNGLTVGYYKNAIDYDIDNNAQSNFTITISAHEATSSGTKIHGTFSGVLYNTSGKKLTITEGKF